MNALKHFVGRSLIGVARSSPHMRPPLRRVGMRTCREWFGSRPVDIDAGDGHRIRLVRVEESYLAFQLFWKGAEFYEPETMRLIRHLLRSAGLFVDVGANIGFYTLMAAVRRNDLDVVAFEPAPKLYSRLRDNVAANDFGSVTCSRLALSDKDGCAQLHFSGSDMTASLNRGFVEDRMVSTVGDGPSPVIVQCTTLDQYLVGREVSQPMVMKIDVEGHEAAVLRGASETIARHRPDIVCEVTKDHEQDPFPDLAAQGYRYYSICDEGLIPVALPHVKRNGDRWFLNYLLTTRPVAEIEALSSTLAAPRP